ncbi:MAG: hypothetical protein NVSMB23_23510 [Myxococcales bacterium]
MSRPGGWPSLLALAAVASCAHGWRGPLPDAAALWDQARAAHRLPETLSGEAKAFIDAPENGGRYALNLAVKKPRSIRIEALTPLGDPAAVLIATEGRFALLDLRSDLFYRGPSTPENLSRLLPAPLRDDELVVLLTGGIPELPGAEPVAVRRDGGDLRLVLSTVVPGARDGPGYEQEVLLGDDLRVKEVRRSRVGGPQAGLLWMVQLDEHDGKSGQQIPRLLHLAVPARRTEVDLRLRDLLVGKPPPSSAFAVRPPPGMPVRELP